MKSTTGTTLAVASVAFAVVGLVWFMSSAGLPRQAQLDPAQRLRLDEVQRRATELIRYDAAIELTATQEQVRQEALSQMAAPCCNENSADTCCCECNLARTIWGLAKHGIADLGYGPEQVRAAVTDWISFINPSGYSGNVCASGGCSRPFASDGCGGMDAEHLVMD